MAKMTGDKKHLSRLRALSGPTMVRAVTAALFGGAQDVQVAAQISITTGAVSGKQHVPSKPGEPPNADTHLLANLIEADVAGPLKARTTSNAPYGAAQEFGSEKLGLPERPYMRPAAKQARPRVARRVTNAVNAVVRSGG